MILLLEIALLLTGAWAMAKAAEYLRLPPILGMLMAGVLLQTAQLPLPESEVRLATHSPNIRLGILAIVLFRVGLGLAPDQFRKAGTTAIRFGLLPLTGDVLFLTLGGVCFLGLSFPAALVLGCLIGAISPAIVIPALLDLIDTRRGQARELLQTLLLGAALDNIVAVVALGIALEFALAQSVQWSEVLWVLPYKLAGGGVLGAGVGALLMGFRKHGLFKHQAIAVTMVWIATGGIIVAAKLCNVSFVIGIIVAGSFLRSRNPAWATELSNSFRVVWEYAQFVLFGLIGYAVLLESVAKTGAVMIGVIALGQLGRAFFSGLSTQGTPLNKNQRVAAALSYVPKATIQASFAALPLDRGMVEGPVILGTAILAIALTAPIGVMGIHHGVTKLLPTQKVDEKG